MRGDRVRQRRFTENITLRCPPSLRRAVDELAERELIAASDYIRMAVLRQLRADGVNVDAMREAGA